MTGYILAGAALALALAAVLWERYRTARTMARLEEMLTLAMDGSFTGERFDESRLSALENRLARYLTASTVSARRLREQKDRVSALVSDISHQTKTPVANLQLYAQLLEEQPLSPEGREIAAAISAQSEKLQSLIEALVKTSRLETGLLALHPERGGWPPWWTGRRPNMPPKRRKRALPSVWATGKGRLSLTENGRKRRYATSWTTP